MLKRLTDIIFAVPALALALPVFFVVAVVIYAHDRGSVFYLQKRVGLRGKVFYIYKFRTMVLNADKIGGFSTSTDDTRITKVGYWLRKSSIDELPQLINVILGDMSLVGPRPDVPSQECFYTEQEWHLRQQVKPGITGLAQATLRSDATASQRKAMDLEYVRNHSFFSDLKIILMTIEQIVKKGGN